MESAKCQCIKRFPFKLVSGTNIGTNIGTIYRFLQRGRIACNAERCNTYSNSVCPSVCLTHAGTLSRRMNVGSRGLHYEVAKTL